MKQIEIDIEYFLNFFLKKIKLFFAIFFILLFTFFFLIYSNPKQTSSYHTIFYFSPDPTHYLNITLLKGMIYKYHIKDNFKEKIKNIDADSEFKLLLQKNKYLYSVNTINYEKTIEIEKFIKNYFNLNEIFKNELQLLKDETKKNSEFYIEDYLKLSQTNTSEDLKKFVDGYFTFLTNLTYSTYNINNSDLTLLSSKWEKHSDTKEKYKLFYAFLFSFLLSVIFVLIINFIKIKKT